MKNRKKKILSILTIVISILIISANVYAHSGRTDSNGGHRDKNNISGLGSYHYHCGGYPAHLHTNGVCPYSSDFQSSNSSSSSNTGSKKTNIVASSIEINEKIEELQVGENKKLTVNILPENTTDKSVTWKSSNENVIAISKSGEIEAIKTGTANITVNTSNGKEDTIKIKVIGEIKEVSNKVTKNSVNQNKINNTSTNSENSNFIAGFMALGAIGGGSYYYYKKHKNK